MADTMAQKTAAQKKSKKYRSYPLALLIAKYAIYILLSAFFIMAFSFYVLPFTVMYRANWGENNIAYFSHTYSALTTDELLKQDIPSPYHYVIANKQKKVLTSDVNSSDAAAIFSQACTATNHTVDLTNAPDAYARCFTSADNSYVVLSYSTEAKLRNRQLRDALPSAELLIVAFIGITLSAAITLISIRQAHILQRELASFEKIADHIKERDLDLDLPDSSIKEVSQTLDAFDIMRSSLKESLHAQFAAEESQRKHIQALTHDMKTPLTVMRGNAELLETTALTHEQSDYVQAILTSADTVDSYVSQLSENRFNAHTISIRTLAVITQDYVQQFCGTSHIRLDNRGSILHDDSSTIARFERSHWERILSNVLSNSVAHSGRDNDLVITLQFKYDAKNKTVIVILSDNGTGFSSQALNHATEWSFTTQSKNNHQGIGLSSSQQLITSLGGTITLSNCASGGACVSLALPVSR